MRESKIEQAKKLCMQIQACHMCNARNEATRPVPGRGNVTGFVLAIGRNPGVEEDLKGQPFIGPIRPIVEQQLKAAGLNVEQDVFFINLISCHTANDRVPRIAEIEVCKQWVAKWITLVEPALIVTYGAMASDCVAGVHDWTRE